MNPKLFNMMPGHPTEETARHLTLVAKVVQNLANMSEFGQKENFMTPCNSFLVAERPRMQRFLDTLAVCLCFTGLQEPQFSVFNFSVDAGRRTRAAVC
jgi:hypothetical protein